MPIIIDGHNLIPNISGLNLRALDDEMQLIELLQVYCRVKRRNIEVYFDGAPAGRTGIRRFGLVTAVFVRKGTQADDAIIAKLMKLGKKARNWRVVTSDRKIQTQARALYAEVVRSESFADEMEEVQGYLLENPSEQSDRKLSDQEIDEWLKLFNEGKGDD